MGSIHMPTAILAGKLGGSSSENAEGLIIPTFTFDIANNYAECDMMLSDVEAAALAGKCVCAKAVGIGLNTFYMQLNTVLAARHEIIFSYVDIAEMYPILTPKQVFKSYVYFNEDGITCYIETESETIPIITAPIK